MIAMVTCLRDTGATRHSRIDCLNTAEFRIFRVSFVVEMGIFAPLFAYLCIYMVCGMFLHLYFGIFAPILAYLCKNTDS